MKSIRIPSLLAVATTGAISAAAQGIELTSVYTTNNNGGSISAGSSLSSNQTLSVGSTISDLGASAWANGAYTTTGTSSDGSTYTNYNDAYGYAYIYGTASGGDDFGRLAITMEHTDFGGIWQPATVKWESKTLDSNGNISSFSSKTGKYSVTPNQTLRAIAGDSVHLGVTAFDEPYDNNATGIGHGSTFRIVNAPDVTISGGTASWSILDNSAADTDLADGSTLIDRHGGSLSLDYLLTDLSTQRGLIASFTNSNLPSPFRDDVMVSLQLSITGENAGGITDTFLLGSATSTHIFGQDVQTINSFNFDPVSGSSTFDPTAWSDGDFILSLDLAINQLAYGHDNAYLDTQLLGSLSSSQSFTLFTGSAVPEPSTYALLSGLAVLGLVAGRRRRNFGQLTIS